VAYNKVRKTTIAGEETDEYLAELRKGESTWPLYHSG
jgi:hypothetical protein